MQDSTSDPRDLHIICERDVGLFSLIQQVVAQIPWALSEDRTPIAYFWDRCCYWTPEGMEGRRSVWEYYFQPLVEGMGEERVPDSVLVRIRSRFPNPFDIGFPLKGNVWVSSHFGDHRKLRGKALSIPYEWDDPGPDLRRTTEHLIRQFVRPRPHIVDRVDEFFRAHMEGHTTIGVHVRGTDSVSAKETRAYRQGSLSFERYERAISRKLRDWPDARVLVATDSEESLGRMRATFGASVIAFESVRHQSGEAAGEGPTGWVIPRYIAEDRSVAARNGAEAVIEYLLLCRCQHLVHNGAGLARTVLLTKSTIPHTNVHGGGKLAGRVRSVVLRGPKGIAKGLAQTILPKTKGASSLD